VNAGPRGSTAGRSRRAATRRTSTTERGRAAERRAAWHYRLRGYRILARNARAGGVELDLIVRRGRRIVFVEVKQKSGPRYGDPLEAVGAWKQERLRRGIAAWLAAHREARGLDVEVEIVAVRGRELERVAELLY
jgi:putative endonuclease